MIKRIIVMLYTFLTCLNILSMLYLHYKFPGYYVHYGFLILNYNVLTPYVFVCLLYVGAVLELIFMTKLIVLIKARFSH